MSNALAPSQLLSTLLGLLPPEVGVLDNATAAIALLAHAIHTALGFRLVKPAATDSEASSSTDPQVRNKLSKDWVDRASGDESFALSYRHEQSSLLFEARIGRLGGRIVVNAVAVEVCCSPVYRLTELLMLTTCMYLAPHLCITGRQDCHARPYHERLYQCIQLSQGCQRAGLQARIAVQQLYPPHRLYLAIQVSDHPEADPWAGQAWVYGGYYFEQRW